MDEQKEKKSTKKKGVDEEKRLEAKKKVNDLLQGTGLEDQELFVPPTPIDVDATAHSNNDAATAWLTEQVAALTKQIEAKDKLIAQLKSGAPSAPVAAAVADTDELTNSITKLYTHLENVYMGRQTKGNTKYERIQFSHPQTGTGVLDLFLRTFSFLKNKKNYVHWR